MRLLIAGKYIQIDEYFELITENPLINNFDTQYAQYSNSITVPYSGELAKAIDVSLLRKSSSPYLLIEGHLIDGVVLLPVKILITNYDPVKNTVTLGVVENNTAAKNLQNIKLTELRHPSSFGDVDECVMPGIEGSVASAFYSGAPLVSPSSEWWNYPTVEANRAIKADLYNIFSRIASNLDVDINFSSLGDLSGKFIFANRFKAHPYDLVHPTGCAIASPNFTANQDKKLIFTSAKLASGTYIDGVDGRLKSNFDVLKMKIPAFSIDLIVSNTTENDRFDVFFNSGQIFLKNSTSIESLANNKKNKIPFYSERYVTSGWEYIF